MSAKPVETLKTLLRKRQVHCSRCGKHWLSEAKVPRCSRCKAHGRVLEGTQEQFGWWT